MTSKQLLVFGLNTLQIYSVSIGFGKHIQQAQAPITTFWKELFILEFFYNVGLTLAKLSVLLFYSRCFGSVNRPFRFALHMTALAVVAWGIIFVSFDIFTCTPVRRAWAPFLPGHCIGVSGQVLGSAISNVSIDLVLLILPLPMLWRLQMSMAKKVSLTIAFALGYW